MFTVFFAAKGSVCLVFVAEFLRLKIAISGNLCFCFCCQIFFCTSCVVQLMIFSPFALTTVYLMKTIMPMAKSN